MSRNGGMVFVTTEEVADHIVSEYAADNGGVATVMPADELRDRLKAVVARCEQFDEDDCDDLYGDVKEAVLEKDVVIA